MKSFTSFLCWMQTKQTLQWYFICIKTISRLLVNSITSSVKIILAYILYHEADIYIRHMGINKCIYPIFFHIQSHTHTHTGSHWIIDAETGNSCLYPLSFRLRPCTKSISSAAGNQWTSLETLWMYPKFTRASWTPLRGHYLMGSRRSCSNKRDGHFTLRKSERSRGEIAFLPPCAAFCLVHKGSPPVWSGGSSSTQWTRWRSLTVSFRWLSSFIGLFQGKRWYRKQFMVRLTWPKWPGYKMLIIIKT